MMPLDQAVSYTVAAIMFVGAVYERLQNAKHKAKTEEEQQQLSDAKAFEARSVVLTKLADDNLKLYTSEHDAHAATRAYWHGKATEFQVTLATCQSQLLEFKAKPDLSEMFRVLQEQTRSNGEILGGIKDILTKINSKT